MREERFNRLTLQRWICGFDWFGKLTNFSCCTEKPKNLVRGFFFVGSSRQERVSICRTFVNGSGFCNHVKSVVYFQAHYLLKLIRVAKSIYELLSYIYRMLDDFNVKYSLYIFLSLPLIHRLSSWKQKLEEYSIYFGRVYIDRKWEIRTNEKGEGEKAIKVNVWRESQSSRNESNLF